MSDTDVLHRSATGRARVRRRRLAAVVGLVCAAWALGLTVVVAVKDFPRGLMVLGCGALVAAGAWEGVLRRGWVRVAGLAVAVGALAGGIYLLVDEGYLKVLVVLGLAATGWHVAARIAFRPDIALPPAERPR